MALVECESEVLCEELDEAVRLEVREEETVAANTVDEMVEEVLSVTDRELDRHTREGEDDRVNESRPLAEDVTVPMDEETVGAGTLVNDRAMVVDITLDVVDDGSFDLERVTERVL